MSFMIKSMEMFISDLARGQLMNIESLCSSTSPPQHVKLSSNPIILRRKLRTNYFFGPVCFLWNSNTGYVRLILKGRASVCGNRAGLTKRSNCPVVREKETCLQHLIPQVCHKSLSLLYSECLTKHTFSTCAVPSWCMTVCPCMVYMIPSTSVLKGQVPGQAKLWSNWNPRARLVGMGNSFHSRKQFGSSSTS